MFFMKKGVLFNYFCFYLDLQPFQSEMTPFISPNTKCELRYKVTKLCTIQYNPDTSKEY